MKLYKQTVVFRTDDSAHTEMRWSGSQADAAAQRAAWTKAGAKRADITAEEVDVPTDKKGLLAFLNAGCQ